MYYEETKDYNTFIFYRENGEDAILLDGLKLKNVTGYELKDSALGPTELTVHLDVRFEDIEKLVPCINRGDGGGAGNLDKCTESSNGPSYGSTVCRPEKAIKLEGVSTKDLADELMKRNGVEVIIAGPYNGDDIKVNGPAIVLVVTD